MSLSQLSWDERRRSYTLDELPSDVSVWVTVSHFFKGGKTSHRFRKVGGFLSALESHAWTPWLTAALLRFFQLKSCQSQFSVWRQQKASAPFFVLPSERKRRSDRRRLSRAAACVRNAVAAAPIRFPPLKQHALSDFDKMDVLELSVGARDDCRSDTIHFKINADLKLSGSVGRHVNRTPLAEHVCLACLRLHIKEKPSTSDKKQVSPLGFAIFAVLAGQFNLASKCAL